MAMKPQTVHRLDRAGAAVSSLCAVHCLALPFVLGALPVLGFAFLLEPAFEWTVIGASALIGVLALGSGAKRHGAPGPLAAFAVGIALFVLARLEGQALAHTHTLTGGGEGEHAE